MQGLAIGTPEAATAIKGLRPQDILKAAEVNALTRSLFFFFEQSFKAVLEPNDEYKTNWHIKYVCNTIQKEVERIAKGEPKEKDYVFNIPIRASKSLMISVCLNAWAWIQWPHLKFIVATNSSSLSYELSDKTRDLIKSDWYRERFGHIFHIRKDQDAKSLFGNNRGGRRISTSTGASIVGKGADIIICDDLLNPDEGESKVKRDSCNYWFDNNLTTRLNNQDIGLMIVVMQRLHHEDLTGHLSAKQGWKNICIPGELTPKLTPEELKPKYTEDGLFFKDRFTKSVLEKYKNNLGKRGYAAQILQSPEIEGGNIFREEHWQYLDERPKKIIRCIQSWDTAFKKGEENDYSVCMTWYEFYISEETSGYYLESVMREKFEFPQLKIRAKASAKHYKPHKIIIEDKASGISLIQELQSDRYLKPLIKGINPDRDKVARAHSVTPIIESGVVYLNSSAAWLLVFLEELKAFPNGSNDDQVDTLTQALLYLTNRINPERLLGFDFI